MPLVWQYFAVGAVLVAAVGFLIWYFIRGRRKKRLCEKCPLNQVNQIKQVKRSDPADQLDQANHLRG